jgi:hypothetical protein
MVRLKFWKKPKEHFAMIKIDEKTGRAVVSDVPAMNQRSKRFLSRYDFLLMAEPKKWDERLFQKMYERLPIVYRSANIITQWTMQSGLKISPPGHLIAENKDPDSIPQLANNLTFIRKWKRYIGFEVVLEDTVLYLILFGNAYLEIVRDPSSRWKITRLVPIKPYEMSVMRDIHGEILGYVQQPPTAMQTATQFIDDYTGTDTNGVGLKTAATGMGLVFFMPDEILHLKNTPMPSDPYGISLYEPLKDALAIIVGMLEDIGIIIRNYAAPTVLFRIGTDAMPPTPAVLDEIQAQLLQQLDANSHIITSSMVQADVLAPGQKAMTLEDYFDLALAYGMMGIGIPEILLGRSKSTTEATAKQQMEAFSRLVKTLQTKIRLEFEKKVFPILCSITDVTPQTIDFMPEIFWNIIRSAEEHRIDWENRFRFGGCTREEWRRELGMKPFPEGELTIDQDKEYQKDLALASKMLGAEGNNGSSGKKDSGNQDKGSPTQRPADREKQRKNTALDRTPSTTRTGSTPA